MAETEGSQPTNAIDDFIATTRQELEKVHSQIDEINLLIEQSQGEVEKLVERNAGITAEVHFLQSNFDTVPREDIRSTYEAAQDAQQRLFTMRGQVEKLASDKKILERFAEFLNRTINMLDSTQGLNTSGAVVASDSVIEQIIAAQEEERRMITRQIHDGPAQGLSNFILQAEIALRLLDIDQDKARQEIANLQQTAGATFAQLRDFIFDLRPMMLDDLGLVPTIRRYVDAIQEKSGMKISLVVTGSERRLDSHREVLIFRAVQEALAAVRDFAQATQTKITVDIGERLVRTTIEDNGTGFDPQAMGSDEEIGQGGGLRKLRDRINLVGGTIDVQSSPGQGSRVIFAIPTTG
jgi:two-component system sensor histidine kinase DegS